MGTILKYLFYAFVVVTIYYIAVGFYEGHLSKDSSISEVGAHVAENTAEMMQSGFEKTKDAVQGGIETLSKEAEVQAEKEVRKIENKERQLVDEVK